MKTRIILTVGCLFLLSTARAQEKKKTEFGIKAGLNLAIFSASVNSESSYKPGLNAGFYVKTQLSNVFYFRPELYYSSQGEKDNYTDYSGKSHGSTTTSLNYINVPVLFEVGKKVTFQFGPQIGFLVSGKEEGTIDNKPVDDDLSSVFKSVDISGVLGIGVAPIEHFNFGARFNIGLSNNYSPGSLPPGVDFPAIKNQVFHFYIAYGF